MRARATDAAWKRVSYARVRSLARGNRVIEVSTIAIFAGCPRVIDGVDAISIRGPFHVAEDTVISDKN